VDLVKNLLITFIWLVTAVDVFCCQWLTPDVELNPMAKWILVNYSVWHLISLKIVGTHIVTMILKYLPIYYSVGVSLFMAWLLGVLSGVFPCGQ
jgi:hypothetical protein